MKNRLAKAVLAVLAFFIASAVVKQGLQAYRENQVVAGAEQQIRQLETAAAERFPDAPVSVAMQQEATDWASKKMATETDDRKRAYSAASMFWGFYYSNVRERSEFCREQGANIQPFVAAFEKAHVNELAKARAIFAQSATDEDKMYHLIKPQLLKMVAQDMSDIAAANKASLKDVCQLLSENGDALVAEMQFSKVQPDVHKVLTLAK